MALTTYQQQEILEQRNNSQLTRRAVVSELENILYEPMPLLDHGFIRVIDYMGNDTAVVQAARVSYGTGTKKVRQDAGLINYLIRNKHSTPFEMCVRSNIMSSYQSLWLASGYATVLPA